MSKVDMTYANYRIYGKKSSCSNKNLLSDMLNELAEVLDFDMSLLREDFSNAKGYMIDETDIPLLKEMVETAKSSEGKRIRCKEFIPKYADTLYFLIEAFLKLAEHNGVSEDIRFEVQYEMNAKTDFVIFKRDVMQSTEKFDVDLERYFFAPTDFLPDEDDELTKSDKCMFLLFMFQNWQMNVKKMRGIYCCFVEERKSRKNDRFIKRLHEMSEKDIEKMVKSTWHQAEFENRLYEDDEYVETIKEFVKIESGGGKLQDKKKVIPLAKKICGIMDRNADDFMTVEEYAKGEPDFGKVAPKTENIREALSESRDVLNEAIAFYESFKAYREKKPLTEDDERLIEICYRQRFDGVMF